MTYKKSLSLCILTVLLILIAIFIAGCTAPSSAPVSATTNGSTVSKTLTTPTTLGKSPPAYSAGDIVTIPGSSLSTAWLVISYDEGTDRYSRALVWRDASGWYRTDTSTETILRISMDRVYTEKVTNVEVSSVKVRSAAVSTIPQSTGTSDMQGTVTTSATVTSKGPLKVTGITPDTGTTNSLVTITGIKGINFKENAKVTLSKDNSSPIEATDVKVVSTSSITCTVKIPKSAPLGAYSVVVTNPDGESSKYLNIFTIRAGDTSTQNDEELSSGGVTITRVNPPSGKRGVSIKIKEIFGTNFVAGATVKLTWPGEDDIVATNVAVQESAKITCIVFPPDTASPGPWDVVVENTDGSFGTMKGGFIVMS